MVAAVMKQALVGVTHCRAFSRCVGLMERWGDNRPNLLRVLTYHRVDDPQSAPDLDPTLISATPQTFARQMEHLAANWHVVPAAEVLDAVNNRERLPPRSVMITFDDADRSFAERAWPVLERLNLPVTLFVPTAFPDQPERAFWWDRLYAALRGANRVSSLKTAYGTFGMKNLSHRLKTFRRLTAIAKSLPHDRAEALVEDLCGQLGARPMENAVLSWDELRRLAAEGVTLGAHSRSHPLMNRISLEESKVEAVGSLHDLEQEIGTALPIFAYPAGGYNKEVAAMLKEEGFQLAFTTHSGVNDLGKAGLLQLKRINVGRRTSEALFRMRLLSWMQSG